MIETTGEFISLTADAKVVATALFGRSAAAYGNGAWIVSTHPARLSTRDGAITTRQMD